MMPLPHGWSVVSSAAGGGVMGVRTQHLEFRVGVCACVIKNTDAASPVYPNHNSKL